MRRSAVVLVLLNVGIAIGEEPPAKPVPFPSISAEPLPKTDVEAAAALNEKLDQPLGDLKLPADATLRETLEAVAGRLGVGLVVDKDSLEEAGLTIDDPARAVPTSNTPISARTFLRLLGEPGRLDVMDRGNSLAFINRSGLLIATTGHTADRYLFTRVYDVRELLEGVPTKHFAGPVGGSVGGLVFPASPTELDASSQMMQLLQQTTSGPWLDIDGVGGTLQVYDGLLVVSQTDEMHAEIAMLLGALQQARERKILEKPVKQPIENAPASKTSKVPGDATQRRDPKTILDEKLHRAVGKIDFDAIPLPDALQQIADAIEADLLIDQQSLDEVGLTIDDTVSLHLEHTEISAEAVLNRLLRPRDLTFLTEDGLIEVTTLAHSDEIFVTRVYDVRDLVQEEPCPPPTRPSVEQIPAVPDEGKTSATTGDDQTAPLIGAALKQALELTPTMRKRLALTQAIINTTSGPWYLDGAGTLTAANGFVFIRHNRSAQAEVNGLLSALRAANGPRCVVDMPSCAEELLDALTYASGGPWLEYDGRGGTSAVFDGVFVIRQTAETHAIIADAIDRMRQKSSAAGSAP